MQGRTTARDQTKIPDTLWVYECHGDRLPGAEPSDASFLGLWMEPPYYYLFFDEPAETLVNRWLETEPGYRLRTTYTLPYSAWRENVVRRERVGPFSIRTGSWPKDGTDDSLAIHLTSGLVFGSGLHPSTRGCLLALAQIHDLGPLGSVLDVGTGSGILALAGKSLGARPVFGLDCNLLAVRETAANIRINPHQQGIHLLVGDGLGALKHATDLLIMNLEWPCLLVAMEDQSWRRFRWVLLSGFLQSQWPELKKHLGPDPAAVLRYCLDDWMTVVLRPRGEVPAESAPSRDNGCKP